MACGSAIVGCGLVARVHARAYRERVRAARDMTSVLLVIGNGLEVSRYQ